MALARIVGLVAAELLPAQRQWALTTMPRVLNHNKTHGIPDGAEYIGRPVPWKRIPGSKWANPYRLRRNATLEERPELIAKYELYLYANGLINQVHELRGKDLVCWCAPERCHLLRLSNPVEH